MIYPEDIDDFGSWDTSLVWDHFPQHTNVLTIQGMKDEVVPPYEFVNITSNVIVLTDCMYIAMTQQFMPGPLEQGLLERTMFISSKKEITISRM